MALDDGDLMDEVEHDNWETGCPDSDDGLHCDHWYDGEECHFCGSPADGDGEIA